MRLTTWNVNGIRNPFSYPPWNTARTFPAMFDILGSDIVVMQELKIQRKDLRDDMVLIDGWDCYFSLPKHKKGYSGVGIYTRNDTCAPIRAEEGLLGVLPSPSGIAYCDLPDDQSIGGYPTTLQVAELGVDPALLDAEGRCVVVEFPAFVLLGVYSPANSNGLRDDFRYGFICALDCRIRNLVKQGKRVVLVGDLNVSRDELDSAGSVDDIRKAGMTHEEYISTPNRRIFNHLIIGGEVAGEKDEGREDGILWDTSREFHPTRTGMYTHWETKINARPGNFGSRIDYVLVSRSMRAWLKDANIQEGLLGSDHCPVFVDFHDEVDDVVNKVHLLDIMNPPGVFEKGARKQQWKVSAVPAFSGKRLPEFDKRRSIKSMFAAPSLRKTQSSIAEESDDPSQAGQTAASAQIQLEAPQTLSGQAQDSSGQKVGTTSPLKRSMTASSRDKSNKRIRSDNGPKSGKGQQSLKGFFQATPKASPIKDASCLAVIDQARSEEPSKPESSTDRPLSKGAGTHSERDLSPTAAPRTPVLEHGDVDLKTPEDATEHPSPASTISPSRFATKLAAVEETQKSWGALFSRPAAPLCEGHQEPCKSMLTKKKGSNQGRSFWMCARPLGPSGNKERGTEWRCPTFIWCSDWSKKADGEDSTS